MIFLTSYLNAGLYGGIELQSMSIDGTYKETYRGETQQWKTTKDLNQVGFTLGYGYVDFLSSEVYLSTNGMDSGKFGTNLRYGFDMFDNNVFPHILFGVGLLDAHYMKFSNNSSTPYADTKSSGTSRYTAGFLQIGVGISYVIKDTIEMYGDIFLMFDPDNDEKKGSFTVEDKSYNNYNYNYNYIGDNNDNTVTVEQTWNTPSIGFQIGIKFHPFGSSTIRGKRLKDELEEEREKSIDAFIN